MGMTFHIRAVRPVAGGGVEDMGGGNTHASVRSNTLFDVLDRVEAKTSPASMKSRFPWFAGGPVYEPRRQPSASECHRPKDVLASLQSVERELQKNAHRYPMDWTFHVPQPDGTRKAIKSVAVHYRGKPCRLFGDERGCWAVETNTPLAWTRMVRSWRSESKGVPSCRFTPICFRS
jgi:hypothetical protein